VSSGDSIAANLERVKERMALAAGRTGRSVGDVTLVAVTKMVSVERILEAVKAGIVHFGENRVQEALAKYGKRDGAGEGLVPRDGISLHMIGTLQGNKARPAAAHFDWVQSVDRPELAEALERAAAQVRHEPLPVLIEVKLTAEASKSGVSAEELPRLADKVASCPHLRACGLMTIARLGASEVELRGTFATLRGLLEKVRSAHPGDWSHLSMGMSDDYEYAIEEGATMVRLGRALFGERNVMSKA
jgi:PLP dependent protein